ncbi:hypothetical protein AXF42_Ash011087 [Apostasia shenzhenica]|uniref:Uncharacterized protein n=1 Tax=Apostasia shenzhenica TaxID=1088818 RepID=A0A2H9ZR34_9ASPA|nr:hypothetical protein AXF42_Ash011087 [Apostasia shenzhenica]
MEKPEEERVELAAGGSPSPPDSTPPRLVYHFPANRPEPAGMQTPPLRLPGSVPFLWEEAPGKPRNHEPCRPGSPSPPSVDPPPLPPAAAVRRSPSFHKKHPPAISFCYALPIMASKSSREKITAWKWGRKKWKMGAMGRLKDANWDNISPSSSSSFSSSSSSSSSSSGLRSFSKAVPPNLNILLDEEEEIEKTEIKATLRLCRSRSRSVRAGRASAQTWGSIYGSLRQLVFGRTERKARDST